MAFRRSAVPEDKPLSASADARDERSLDGLTRAQVRALSRCAPLTPDEFKARRRVADQGIVPLRGVLDEDADTRPR